MKLFVIFSVLVVISGCNDSTIISPQRKNLVDAVYASGVVMPEGYYKLSSNFEGNLTKVLVKEGDFVNVNQSLLEVDPELYEYKSNANTSAYQVALHNAGPNSPVLNELGSTINTLLLKYKQDSLNFNRFQILLKSNAISKLEYEKAELSANASRNEYKAALDRYTKTQKQLQSELKAAEANLNSTSKDQRDHVLKALTNSKVYEIYKRKGELVRKGEALILLGSKNTYLLELWIDEEDIQLVKKGQEVLVTSDIYKDTILNAVISEIYPSLNVQKQAIKVEAVLQTTKSFPANSNVEANIILAKIPNALIVPKYVVGKGDTVLVKSEDDVIKRKIIVGIDQGDFVQVLSGISENDKIVVPSKKKK